MMTKRNLRKAFVFSLEALLTLCAAITLVALVSVPTADSSWNSLARGALAQDLLETGVKQKAFAQRLYAFADGSEQAEREIETEWTALLAATGAGCFKLEAGSGTTGSVTLETKCVKQKRFAAAAKRILYDGTRFNEATLTLYFES